MAEIDFENGRISNFQRHVTLTVTLDRAIWHLRASLIDLYLRTKFHSNPRTLTVTPSSGDLKLFYSVNFTI